MRIGSFNFLFYFDKRSKIFQRNRSIGTKIQRNLLFSMVKFVLYFYKIIDQIIVYIIYPLILEFLSIYYIYIYIYVTIKPKYIKLL